MLNKMLAIASLLSVAVLGSPHSTVGAEPAGGGLGITEKERTMLTEIANKKARELGFNPEQSNFRLTKENDLFKADYWPKEKKA